MDKFNYLSLKIAKISNDERLTSIVIIQQMSIADANGIIDAHVALNFAKNKNKFLKLKVFYNLKYILCSSVVEAIHSAHELKCHNHVPCSVNKFENRDFGKN